MSWKSIFLKVFPALFIIVFCRSEKPSETIPLPGHVTSEIVDGITYIHNARIPFTENILKPDLIIPEEGDDYYFGDMSIVRENNRGDIFVLDWRVGNIKKFDYNGSYIKTLRKKGQGPGEMETTPIDIGFYSDDRMLISEGNRYKLHIFDPEDNYIKTYIRKKKPWRLTLDGDGFLYEPFRTVRSINDPYAYDFDLPAFQKSDGDLNIIKTFGQRIRNYKPNIAGTMNGSIIGVSNKGDMYACYLCLNRIEIYRNDSLNRVIDRELHFDPVEPYFEGQGRTAKGQIDRIVYGYNVAIDSLGNFYILTCARSKYNGSRSEINEDIECLLEIFNKDGWLLYCIPLRDYSPSNIYIGRGNKIYLSDWKRMSVVRLKAIM